MSEIDRVAYLVYSVPIFALFSFTTLLCVKFFSKYISANFKLLIPYRINNKQELIFLNYFYFGLLSLLIINLLLSPIPLLNSGNIEGIYSRFDFWPNAKFPILSIFGGTASFLVIIAGIHFVENPRRGLFMVAVYLLYIVLLGHKFGTLMTTTFYFFMPLVLTQGFARVRIKVKHVAYACVVGLTLFIITLANYSKVNPYRHIEGATTPLAAIFYRGFALQSQLTWVTIEQHIYLGKSPTYRIAELPKGMLHLMDAYHFAAGSIDTENHTGSTLTNGYPGILIHILPPVLAFLSHFIFVAIFGSAIGLCILLLKSKQYILVCALYMFIQQLLMSLSDGSMKNGFISMVFILISIVSFLGYRTINK
jgi:tryptophan-rich sensory protein